MTGHRVLRTPLRALGGALLVAALIAGCSSSDDDSASSGDDATTTTDESGSSGSSGSSDTTGSDGASDTTATTGADGEAPAAPEVTEPVTDVAAEISDADLGCDEVTYPRTVDGTEGAAQCDLTESPAYLYAFADDDQRDAFIDGGGVIDCTFIFGADITFKYVVADGAIVRPEDNADADALADALGGEVRTLECAPPAAGG